MFQSKQGNNALMHAISKPWTNKCCKNLRDMVHTPNEEWHSFNLKKLLVTSKAFVKEMRENFVKQFMWLENFKCLCDNDFCQGPNWGGKCCVLTLEVQRDFLGLKHRQTSHWSHSSWNFRYIFHKIFKLASLRSIIFCRPYFVDILFASYLCMKS